MRLATFNTWKTRAYILLARKAKFNPAIATYPRTTTVLASYLAASAFGNKGSPTTEERHQTFDLRVPPVRYSLAR
jgi:hypothetical protein